MSINRLRGKVQKSKLDVLSGIESFLNTKTYKRITHTIATAAFCMVLALGTVSRAEEPAKVTVASAVIRQTADTSSTALGSVKQNETVSVIEETTGTDGKVWYKVFVNATTTGYIRGDLVEKTGTSSETTTTATATNNAANETTNVTAVENKAGTVVTSNVRIRKGASTNADVVATANRGMVVTVTGEAAGTDGKTWYQISFSYNSKNITGFIRSDLVTFDSLPADTAISEITGTEGEEEQPTEAATEEVPQTEETAQEPASEETTTQTDDTAGIILLNVEEVPYIMPGFSPIILKWEEQDINAFKNGAFYIFYAQKQNGEEGWYVFDSESGTYQRYPYSEADVTTGDSDGISIGLFPVVILAVIIVILLAVIGLLFLRLRGLTDEYDEYDEYDDEEDDMEEDLEELEIEEELEEEEEERPREKTRKSRPAQSRPQPRYEQTPAPRAPREDVPSAVRREGDRPVRRPENGNVQNAPVRREGDRPVRRPENAGNGPVRQGGERPARRPETAGNVQNAPIRREGDRPVRRADAPQGQGNAQARRPQGNGQQHQGTQPRPVKSGQPQKGYKAKNFLEAEDDDMEFIDL